MVYEYAVRCSVKVPPPQPISDPGPLTTAMPLLTFQRRWEGKLLSGEKRTTVRANARRWLVMAGRPGGEAELLLASGEGRFPNAGPNVLHVWLGNPRQLGRRPWVRKLGESTPEWEVGLVRGADITDGLARRDGLEDAGDLREGLARLNGMTADEVEAHLWAVVRWEWATGPAGSGRQGRRWAGDGAGGERASGGQAATARGVPRSKD